MPGFESVPESRAYGVSGLALEVRKPGGRSEHRRNRIGEASP